MPRPKLLDDIWRSMHGDVTPAQIADLAESLLLLRGKDPIEVARINGHFFGNLFRAHESIVENLERKDSDG